MILDTSALLAYFDRNEPQHEALVRVIESAAGPLVISPFVLAELDYLVPTPHGGAAEQAVLDELVGGAWELATIDRSRLAAANRIADPAGSRTVPRQRSCRRNTGGGGAVATRYDEPVAEPPSGA